MIEDGRPLVTNDFEVDRVHRLKKGSGLPVKTQVIDMIEIGVGRRLDRAHHAARPARRRAALGGREPRAGLLRPGRRGADGHRRRPRARLPRSRLLPRRRRARSTPSAPARRSSARSPSRSGSTSRGRRSGSTRSSTRTWPAPRASPSWSAATIRPASPLFAFGGAGPVHAAGVARSARRVARDRAGRRRRDVERRRARRADGVRLRALVAGGRRRRDHGARRRAVRRDGARGRGGAGRLRRRAGRHRLRAQPWTCATAARASRSPWSSTRRPRARPTACAARSRRPTSAATAAAGRRVPVEVINWRVTASGPAPAVSLDDLSALPVGDAALKGHRDAYFEQLGGYHSTPVYDRYGLDPGAEIDGPAIVEERESTLIVPPAGARRRGAGSQPGHPAGRGGAMTGTVALDPLVVGPGLEPPRLDPRGAAGHARHDRLQHDRARVGGPGLRRVRQRREHDPPVAQRHPRAHQRDGHGRAALRQARSRRSRSRTGTC